MTSRREGVSLLKRENTRLCVDKVSRASRTPLGRGEKQSPAVAKGESPKGTTKLSLSTQIPQEWTRAQKWEHGLLDVEGNRREDKARVLLSPEVGGGGAERSLVFNIVPSKPL